MGLRRKKDGFEEEKRWVRGGEKMGLRRKKDGFEMKKDGFEEEERWV